MVLLCKRNDNMFIIWDTPRWKSQNNNYYDNLLPDVWLIWLIYESMFTILNKRNVNRCLDISIFNSNIRYVIFIVWNEQKSVTRWLPVYLWNTIEIACVQGTTIHRRRENRFAYIVRMGFKFCTASKHL